MTRDDYNSILPHLVADWRDYRDWKSSEHPGDDTSFEGFMNFLSLRDKGLIKLSPVEDRLA